MKMSESTFDVEIYKPSGRVDLNAVESHDKGMINPSIG
jgi:hypothetical protein